MHVPVRVIRPQEQRTVWLASADIPTRFGTFATHVFRTTEPGDGACEHEHVALVYGDVRGGEAVPVRIHSECMTSEVFGSLKCDCKEQLDAAMAEVARRGAGAILYLRQEGRGIGLANKIRAYNLQSQGHDTVDANRLLGLPDDAREYHAAAHMLSHFDVKSVVLMTNNPAKVSGLTALGVKVDGRLPVIISPNPFSRGYLDTKRERMDHALPNTRLEDQPLRNTRLEDQPLRNTRLEDQPLRNTRLEDQPLRNTRLEDQPLRNTRLEDQPLRNTRLEDQPLRNTRLEDQPLRNTRLEDQPLRNTRFDAESAVHGEAE